MQKIRPEFYVNLKGKMYPTWPGVLVALHENGLLGIQVTPLQMPTDDNGFTAICQATVTMKGDGEREMLFTEIGDASPKTCSPMIALAALRMAATRAKGRAGRDAIACGETLREEIPDDQWEGETARAGNGHAGADRPQLAHGQASGSTRRAKHDPADEAARASSRPVVADEPAAAVLCTAPDCGAVLNSAEIKASRKRWTDMLLCQKHGRQKVAADKVAAGAPAAT